MNDKIIHVVKCPTCSQPVPWVQTQRYKPFCSERCKLIDLGEWAMEAKRIPGEPVFPAPDNEDPD